MMLLLAGARQHERHGSQLGICTTPRLVVPVLLAHDGCVSYLSVAEQLQAVVYELQHARTPVGHGTRPPAFDQKARQLKSSPAVPVGVVARLNVFMEVHELIAVVMRRVVGHIERFQLRVQHPTPQAGQIGGELRVTFLNKQREEAERESGVAVFETVDAASVGGIDPEGPRRVRGVAVALRRGENGRAVKRSIQG